MFLPNRSSRYSKLIDHQETSSHYYEFLEYLDKPVMTLTELLKANGGRLAPPVILTILKQLVSSSFSDMTASL